jgi:ligand-binding sensor domain-containing protein
VSLPTSPAAAPSFARVGLLAVLFFALGWPCRALDRTAGLGEFRRRAWTSSQGLPQDRVQCVRQTRDGYLWIGTNEGLARFDGQAFRVVSKVNTPAVPIHSAPRESS